MNIRRPQLRMRTLLLAVVILAAVFGIVREVRREWRLSDAYRKTATRLAESESLTRRQFESNQKLLAAVGARIRSFESAQDARDDSAEAEERRQRLALLKANHAMLSSLNEQVEVRHRYYADLWRKYDRAASHPWLPVAPDPPEPEAIQFFDK